MSETGHWIDITGIADFEMAHSLHAPHVPSLPDEPKDAEVVTCGGRVYAWQPYKSPEGMQ
jgi:hypothetical protein